MNTEELLKAKNTQLLLEKGLLTEEEFNRASTGQEKIALRQYKNIRDGYNYATLVNKGFINEDNFRRDQDYFKLQDFRNFNRQPGITERILKSSENLIRNTGKEIDIAKDIAGRSIEATKQAGVKGTLENIASVPDVVGNLFEPADQPSFNREQLAALQKQGHLPKRSTEPVPIEQREEGLAELEGFGESPTSPENLAFFFVPALNRTLSASGEFLRGGSINTTFLGIDRVLQYIRDDKIDPVTAEELVGTFALGGTADVVLSNIFKGVGRTIGKLKEAREKNASQKVIAEIKQQLEQQRQQLLEAQRARKVDVPETQGTPTTQEVDIEALTGAGAGPSPQERTKEIFGGLEGTTPGTQRIRTPEERAEQIFGIPQEKVGTPPPPDTVIKPKEKPVAPEVTKSRKPEPPDRTKTIDKERQDVLDRAAGIEARNNLKNVIEQHQDIDTEILKNKKVRELLSVPKKDKQFARDLDKRMKAKGQSKDDLTREGLPEITQQKQNQLLEEILASDIPKKDKKALGKLLDTEKVAPVEEPSKVIPKGKSQKVATENLEVETRFEVVDANDLVTSADKGYPQQLQPRLRGERIASEEQIGNITRKLDLERLTESRTADTGAPIAGPDLVVESGNGRIQAIRRAYSQGKGQEIKDFLKANAERFGIDPADIDNIENPVLTRIRTSDVDRVKFTQEANVGQVQQLGATEKARVDAQRMTLEDLNHIDFTKKGEVSIENSKEFIRSFVKKVPINERNTIETAEGELSTFGVSRIKNALFAKAYDDPDAISIMAESLDDNIKNIHKGLVVSSPRMASLKAFIDKTPALKDYDVSKDIAFASRQVNSLRSQNKSVQEFINNHDLIGDSRLTKEIMQIFEDNKTSPENISEIFERYANEVEFYDTRQQSIIDRITPQSILKSLREDRKYGPIPKIEENQPPRDSVLQVGKKGKDKVAGKSKTQPKRPEAREAETAFGKGAGDEKESQILRDTIEAAEKKFGRKLTKSELQTIENAIYLRRESVPDNIPDIKNKKAYLNTMRSAGKEEEAIGDIIASQGKPSGVFADAGTYAETAMTKANPDIVELPELIEMIDDLNGRVPKLVQKFRKAGTLGQFSRTTGDIKILDKLASQPDKGAKTIAHEFGHLIDSLPDGEMRRGNILGSIASLFKYKQGQFMKDNGELLFNNEIRQELKDLTHVWKPFDPNLDKKYTSYRYSSRELYADALSVLFNDPALLRQKSPKFYRAFLDYMNRKPDFAEKYNDILDRIARGKTVEHTSQRIDDMIERGEQAFREAMEEPSLREQGKEVIGRARIEFIDAFDAVLQRVKRVGEKTLSWDDNPRGAIEKALYGGSEAELHLRELKEGVIDKLTDAGLEFKDFDKFLLLRRTAGDRKDIYNPLGITEKRANEVTEFLKKNKYTEQQFNALEKATKDFHNYRQFIIDKIEESGYATDELLKHLRNNDTYATFNVRKYFEDKYGAFLTGKIYAQRGTFEEILPPGTATILKDINLIHATNWNSAKRSVINFMKEHYSPELMRARVDKAGHPVPPGPKQGIISFLDEGKAAHYYVPKMVALGFERSDVGDMVAFRLLNTANSWFRQVFINKNLGFAAYNIIRDSLNAANQLPGSNIINFIPSYLKAIKPAFRSVFRTPDDVVREMLKNNELISIANRYGFDADDVEIERLLKRFSITEDKWNKGITKPFFKALDFIDKFNQALERTPKVASHIFLRDRFPNMPDAELRHLVTVFGGSPSFLRKGRAYGAYNNIYLFGNAIKEGMRTLISHARKSPAGFITKVVGVSALIPKSLMFMAQEGLLGDHLKAIMAGVSEYDKTNYHIIPIGLTEDGKSVVIRVPNPEPVRWIGGMIWKTMNIDKESVHTGLRDISKEFTTLGAGQAPNLTPLFSVVNDVVEYYGYNRNPYDAFRGRNVIPDRIFNSDHPKRDEIFLKHISEELGARTFFVFEKDTDKHRAKNKIEELYGVPFLGPIVSRFIKVTDQGIWEQILYDDGSDTQKRRKIRNTQNIYAEEYVRKVVNNEKPTQEERIAFQSLDSKRQQYQLNKVDMMKARKSGNIRLQLMNNPGLTNEEKEIALRKLKELGR